MNQKTQYTYRFVLWPAACARQGWDREDEAMRRDVTLEAIGKTSTAGITNGETTRLFDFLKLLANPDSLDHAMPVANPEVGEEADRKRQLLHVIDELHHAESYIVKCAEGHRRRDKVKHWRELSIGSLEKLRFTLLQRARKRDADAELRPPFEPTSIHYHQREKTRRKKAAERAPQVVPRPGTLELLPF